MPVTTRIIIPESGSSRNPQGAWNMPMPPRVASGIEGIHCATTTSKARASFGRPSNCQNAYSDTPRASVIVVHAIAPAILREKYRMPSRPLIAAPMAGSSGMSQI